MFLLKWALPPECISENQCAISPKDRQKVYIQLIISTIPQITPTINFFTINTLSISNI